jgi:hypothetical protein
MARKASHRPLAATQLLVTSQNPTTNLASADIASRRNKEGLTWSQKETVLRGELSATLSGKALEDEIKRRFRHFILYELTNPAADRRQQLFDEAYAATPVSGRKRLIDIAAKTLT